MKRAIINLTILILCFCLISCGKDISKNQIKVLRVVGDVTVSRVEEVKTPLQVGDILAVEDEIITAQDSAATIILKDIGVFKLKENTKIKMISLIQESYNMKLGTGKILIALRKLSKLQKVSIETPTAVVGVRGTSFLVEADKKQTKVAVLTGKVSVKNDKEEVEVLELEEAKVIPDTKIKIKKISEDVKNELVEIVKIKEEAGIKEDFNKKEVPKKIKHLTKKTIGGIEFVYIKEGEFMMGSPDSDLKAKQNEKPQHKVYVSGFWMSRYETTQKQYMTIMDINPSKFNGDNHPAHNMNWENAFEFCSKFSRKYEVKARLPYEAEWEYACRAGTTTKYYWGDTFNGEYCWHKKNSDGMAHPVGLKKPNKWGLYDMIGNAAEWCMDWYAENYYKKSPYKNPKGPGNGKFKVERGGWFAGIFHRRKSRCAQRFIGKKGKKGKGGLRVVISPE